MHHFSFVFPVACAFSLASFPVASRAAYLTTTSTVGGNTGWNTAGIWKTNGTGTAVTGVFPGNTYACLSNGIPFGNNVGNTRMRNLYATTSPMFQTFPGDSLTLNTNAEFRFKRISSSSIPTVDFPGVGGEAGLILNGGVLNPGDDGTFPVSGKIRVDAQSYIATGNNGGGELRTARRFNITAQVTGSGNLVLFQSATNLAQEFSNNSNTFSGQWIIKSGRLLGSGTNSLGTNDITVDPAYVVPLAGPFLDVINQAVLEVNYDLNSAGRLTLTNGGTLRLHQNCVFSSVIIEGVALTAGTHYYAELLANFGNNIEAGGSGSLTVQPYGPPPLLIVTQPGPQRLYAGATAHFTATVAGTPPITYQWLKNGSPLADGGNIAGATNLTLTVTGVGAGDVAYYSLRATNVRGTTTSSAAALTLVTPGEPYESAVAAAQPAVFYQLNETGDPAPGTTLVFDYAGGFNGTYGAAAQNGFNNVTGPAVADGLPGFAAGNKAASFANLTAASNVRVPPWNLNTNTVTITAWINPSTPQFQTYGLVFCRGSGTVAGLNYSSATDPSTGSAVLGYNWNNEWETYTWNSGLTPPIGQWSFVALVVTSTNATIHLITTNGMASSTHVYGHIVQSFTGTTLIGDDSASATGVRTFNGAMDDVAVFARALSKSDLVALYAAAAGAAPNFAPIVGLQPTNQTLYVGQKAQLAASGGGSEPVTYRWQRSPTGLGTFSDLSDGGRISGAGTPTLVISNLAEADSADYQLKISNAFGATNSSVANLTVQAVSAPENLTLAVQQAAGNNWDTGADWSDGQPASISAAQKPGSTYEVLAGGRLRTPEGPRTAVFPGERLTLNGDAIRNVDPAAGATISEIRFKQPNPGTVIFKKLVMNGGQLDSGNNGIVVIDGEINVLTNAPINNDSGNDRGYRIDAKLTGSGSIEYWGYNQTGFMSNYVNNLNIAGTNNTFSGKWNVVLGTLLGTGATALGTNDITVGVNGALQTTYDLNNPKAVLTLNGRMYLHQHNTFKSVLVGGVPLSVGTYTFAQLNAAFPAFFPSTWTPQVGAEAFTNGSGSLTVLLTPAPTILAPPASASRYPTETVQFTVIAQGTPPMFYQWRKDGVNLADSGNLFGVNTTNLTLTNIIAGNAGTYDVVVTNSIGAVTSVVATLTLLPTGPAQNLTLDYGGTPIIQASGLDWNTITNWSDGQPASVSALSNPGSTYRVVAGSRLRTPDAVADATFPGDVLVVEGDGVYTNGGTSTIGEIRFKQSTDGIVRFKKLVLNGGQIDTGNAGNAIIAGGEVSVLANSVFYNDNASSDRGYRIDSWLTGAGGIEYHGYDQAAFRSDYVYPLNIAGTSNTFSGKWNVVIGVLLGSGMNSLGTNDITIRTEAALETTYDINAPGAKLTLEGSGRMFLHQNDRFAAVNVAGNDLAPGTYTFAQLNALYPANFPATWMAQIGSEVSTGSGSLIVGLAAPPEVKLGFQFSGASLQLNWSQGTLLEATNVTGPWTTNAATPPFTVSPIEPRKFYRVQVQ